MTKPLVVLAILDGFGENPDTHNNAVAKAHTPTLDMLKADSPHGLIDASGLAVGLPEGQMGNSEVGHMNIGSGRVVMQDLPRIDRAIKDGSLAANPELKKFIEKLKASHGDCHLLGLLSPGGVHSHQKHIAELANIISAQGIKVFIHAFLDGRDTPPRSALDYIADFEKDFPDAVFATAGGRYYAMDRDSRWDRVQLSYQAMVEGGNDWSKSIENVVGLAYDVKHVNDEFVPPSTIGEFEKMKDGDGILMANFRADRARQILQALLEPEFKGFARKRVVKFAAALGMMEYSASLNRLMPALFRPEKLDNILAAVLEAKKLRQLHIAETEKYAHVTFFFNGGREEPFEGEKRILIPSPSVATYDMQPEMSAFVLTDKLVEAIEHDEFDFIVVNYANCDMVGHTGDLEAATKAVEAVDKCMARVWKAVEQKNGVLVITADHGNVEQMHDEETEQPHTAHTLNLVPIIVASNKLAGKQLHTKEGRLCDIAPTVLKLLGITPPKEMTGQSLL